MKKIPFIKPVFPSSSELSKDFEQIVENNFYTNGGPFEKKLESSMAGYLDESAVSSIVSNATVGLMLAIKHLIGEPQGQRKDVIIQSFTFAAGGEAILWCGLQPVFIDINLDSLQPNITQARDYIGKNPQNVSGILLCNTFGVGNKEVEKWEQLAEQSDLPLIIDSAAGFGSKYSDSEKVGIRGDCEIFSLHATKPFAVGEGGLIASKSKDFIDSINQLKNFGFDASREAVQLGLNAKVPEIISAIGLRQLLKLDDRIAARQGILNKYKTLLEPIGLKFQPNDSLSTIPFVSVILPTKDTQQSILKQLERAGVEARSYYSPALHEQELFRSYKQLALDNTYDICCRILSLPVHDDMSDDDINYICEIIAGEVTI